MMRPTVSLEPVVTGKGVAGATDPFFIVGAERSGTTMLRLMLMEHERLHLPPESHFLTDLMDALPLEGSLSSGQLREAERILTSHERWRDWQVDDAVLHEALASLHAPTLAMVVDAAFRATAGTKARWGCQTPRYVREVGRIHRLFPGAKFIHLMRDARDVYLSLKAKGWWGGDVVSIAEYWTTQVMSGMKQGASLPPGLYLEVRYEDLVRDTEAVLHRVCAFLGEDFEPAMLAFYRHARERIPERVRANHAKTSRAPQPSDLERWRRELRARQVLAFETLAGPTMRRAGQRLHFRRAAPLLRPGLRAALWVAERTLRWRRALGLNFGWLWTEL